MARTFAGFRASPLSQFRGNLTDLGRRASEDDPDVAGLSFGSAPNVGAALTRGGGYERASIPNPNFAGGAQKGQRTSPQFGSPSNDPRRPMDTSQLAAQADAVDAADTARRRARLAQELSRGGIDSTGMANMDMINKSANRRSPWRNFLQAIQNAGADEMQTGAVAGWEKPGFYDTQSTMSADAQDRQRLLEALLMNQGRQDDANFVRGIR